MFEKYTADCLQCSAQSVKCANVESAKALARQHRQDFGPDHDSFYIIAHVETYLKETYKI